MIVCMHVFINIHVPKHIHRYVHTCIHTGALLSHASLMPCSILDGCTYIQTYIHTYRSAAESRIPHAMFNLGWMYEHGVGVDPDPHLAKRFYDLASETSPEAVCVYICVCVCVCVYICIYIYIYIYMSVCIYISVCV